jgi:hypothetical protein
MEILDNFLRGFGSMDILKSKQYKINFILHFLQWYIIRIFIMCTNVH